RPRYPWSGLRGREYSCQILHPLPSCKVIVTERRANAGNLVRSHGGADPAAAQQNATVHFSTCHGASKGNCKIRVVIVGVIYAVAKIDDLMALCRQQMGELLLHFESAVIRAYPIFKSSSFSAPSLVLRDLALRRRYNVLYV